MELGKTQALLARLYTDCGFRNRFLKDPESVASEAEITTDDCQRLAQACGDQVIGFARSLLAKRLNEVRPLLPQTARALGAERFQELFLAHAAEYLPVGINKPREDAVEFGKWLERQPASAGNARPSVRYERTTLESYDPERRLIIRLFRLPTNPVDPDSATRLMLGIWLRRYDHAPLLHRLISFPRIPERPPFKSDRSVRSDRSDKPERLNA